MLWRVQYKESALQRGAVELSNAVRDGTAVIYAHMPPGTIRFFGVAVELVEINPQAVGLLKTTEAHLRNLVAKFFRDALNQAMLWDRNDTDRYKDLLRTCKVREIPQALLQDLSSLLQSREQSARACPSMRALYRHATGARCRSRPRLCPWRNTYAASGLCGAWKRHVALWRRRTCCRQVLRCVRKRAK